MKNISLIAALLLIFTACNEDEDPQPQPQPLSQMESTGILGNWEIQERSYDNISDLTAKCCEFLLFEEDNNVLDLKGKMTSTSVGSNTEWVFTINPSDSSVIFERNDQTKTYSYAIDNDRLDFEYMDDSVKVSETWIKK